MNWINYLIQTNLYLLCFYALYMLAYQRETYFNTNRIYLIGFTALSFFIPFWQSGIIQDWFITQKVSEQVYASGLSEIMIESNVVVLAAAPSWTWKEILMYIYICGAILSFAKILFDLIKVSRFIKGETAQGTASSFMGKVKIDPSLPHQDILQIHEEQHGTQKHTFDLILLAIVKVICWFNPIVYLLHIEFKKIHEFLADAHTADLIGSKAKYAEILVSSQFNTSSETFIHNFYEKATLKTRLIMLTRKKSTKRALLKYGLIAPLFLGTLVLASSFVNPNSQKLISDEVLDRFAIESLFNETIDVKGTVNDEEGNGLPGTSIKVLGTDRITTTDVNGTFSIDKLTNGSMIKVAFVGYETTDVTVFSSDLSITMKPTSFKLEEVVVAGYEKSTPLQNENISKEVSLSNPPEFPGGVAEMYRFIGRNLKYPQWARVKKVEGEVLVSFTIDKEGNTSNPQIIKGIGSGCDEEVKRIIDIMPKWKPARQNGRGVNVKYEIPVKFILEEKTTDQVAPDLDNESLVFTQVDDNPEFIGGVKKMYEYISNNLKYPKAAEEAGVEGRLYVKFIVQKDGNIGDIQILRALGHGCEDEVKRILKNMPPWIPGYQDGKPVNVYFTMPFQFKLGGEIKEDIKEVKKRSYFLNGKASSSEEVQKIDKEYIQGMNLLSGEKAKTKYGVENAVEVWTKGHKMPSDVNKVNFTPKVDKKIYLVDGKEMTKAEVTAIPTENIASVDVLKGAKATSIYGARGSDGVVKINLKDIKVTGIPYSEGNKKLKGIKSDQSGTFANPTFVVDGRKMSKEEYQALDLKANEIANMNTLKGAKASEKYGKDAVGGVIEITLKISFEDLISQRPFDSSPIPEGMLIIIDGKESSRTQLGKITNGQIKYFTKYKGKKAVRKYGEKARGGVYVFTLKK